MTVTPEELADRPDLLSSVLAQLRISSAIFFRGEFGAPWACATPPARQLSSALSPGAERLILFHIVALGRCRAEIEGSPPIEAQQGDVIVLPYADVHTLCGPLPTPPVSFMTLLPPPPWSRLPVIRYGGGGERTDIVCGYLHCDDLLFDPALCALPPLFSVRPPPGPAASWVEASVRYAISQAEAGQMVATRLPELLLAEVLRLHVASRQQASTGWLAAIHDPVVGPALRALHGNPTRKWTVRDLAREAATSRTVLDKRFRAMLARPPMRYLAQWRLQLASRLLGSTQAGIAEIAWKVGYESEAAFTRAFKRHIGLPPARWRDAHVEPANGAPGA